EYAGVDEVRRFARPGIGCNRFGRRCTDEDPEPTLWITDFASHSTRNLARAQADRVVSLSGAPVHEQRLSSVALRALQTAGRIRRCTSADGRPTRTAVLGVPHAAVRGRGVHAIAARMYAQRVDASGDTGVPLRLSTQECDGTERLPEIRVS